MNDFLNCVQMIQLPFALIPIITFTSSPKIMHDFKSSKAFQIFALVTSAIILTINVYFIIDYVSISLGSEWYVYMALVVPTTAYILFVGYLTVYSIPETISIRGFNFIRDYENDAPWINRGSMDNEGYESSSHHISHSAE
uniref:Sodium-coupled neutral amino acid transporter 10 n=1 Tax=Heterorhabditis bacteriophora TaxID=37862 RepID=A0A1I7WA82_HETBA